MSSAVTEHDVLCCSDIGEDEVRRIAARYGISVAWLALGSRLSGSFWGEPEAGIVGRQIYLRPDTPVHSLLHEACHVVCMTAGRREQLLRDAGGDDLEEAAVCYLQVLLADCIEGLGRRRLTGDMDAWGYSFRLGSAGRWFAEDAEDARAWLLGAGLIDCHDRPLFRLRQ